MVVIVCVLVGLFVVQTMNEAELDSTMAFFGMFMTVLVVGIIVYWCAFHQFMSNISWLKKSGYMGIADDIDLVRPTYPDAQLYCGKNAFFCRKNGLILPYAMIAWVHLYEQKAYGVVTVQKCFNFHTMDGKTYSLKLSVEQVQQLLQDYILPHSPKLIVGYGKDQVQRYKTLRKNYKAGQL